MDDEEGGGFRLSKKPWEKDGEVDYKTKAGTAWSHSFLNQKPWHPLSYPNQRRKWIAEQTHAQKERRAEEVSREYAQEQEFLKQTALVSKREKEKLEMMKAVSFMYVKPPGYNPESAKAAEMADEKKQDDANSLPGQSSCAASSPMNMGTMPSAVEKKKGRPKDVFGRALPTEEQFEVLKNAPKLETGVAGRAKPFGVEIRNVKCLRCGNHGHQSGDRECPLKDAIMPNEENRLKRDDPLTAIQAQTDCSEPLKWELKQKPGLSPPRGGFNLDDPNQQIVAEDIFDEYGGFLGEPIIPELLTNISSSKTKNKFRKNKHNDRGRELSSDDDDGGRRSKKRHKKKRRHSHLESNSSESSDDGRYKTVEKRDRGRELSSDDDDGGRRSKKQHKKKRRRSHLESNSSESSDDGRYKTVEKRDRGRELSSDDDDGRRSKKQHKKKRRHSHLESNSSESSDDGRYKTVEKKRSRHKHHHHSRASEAFDSDKERRNRHHHSRRHHHRRDRPSHRRHSSSED